MQKFLAKWAERIFRQIMQKQNGTIKHVEVVIFFMQNVISPPRSWLDAVGY